MLTRLATLVFTFFLLLFSEHSTAEANNDGASPEWEHSLVLYLLGPTIEGTVGVGRIEGDMKIDPSDVFDSLEMGFLGGWVAEKDGWGFMLDVVYMDLEADVELVNGRVPGEIGNTQLITVANGLYPMTESLQFMVGVLYNDVTMKVNLDGPLQPRSARTSESWFDPMLGLRYERALSERWAFATFGQIGGFGVSSDFTWQAAANVSWSITGRTSLMLGYRYIDFDYDSGEGRDRFKFDIAEHGFAAGFRFDF